MPKVTVPQSSPEFTSDDRKLDFQIKGDILFRYEPIFGKPSFYRTTPVITKEAFVKCYNEWIKGESE